MKKLTEVLDPGLLEVLEESKEGVMRLRLPFLAGDLVSENKRRYPKKVLKTAVEELQGRLARRDVYGASSHPKGSPELNDVSHLIESVDFFEDGKDSLAWAIIKVLPTSKGKDVQAIIKNGGRLGVSSRGLGTVKTAADGIDEVQDDFRIQSFDFTLNPAFAGLGAGKEQILESAPVDSESEDNVLSESTLRARYEKACGLANYRGTFEDYKLACDEARLKNLLQFRERHTFAKRQCGSTLDEEAFAKAERKE